MGNVTVIIGCVGFGMFLLGVYWGYIFGQMNKGEKQETLKDIEGCEKCYSLARAYRNDNEKLKTQNVEMQCCGNCRFSESDKLNGTFCHREGCFVVASAKCKLWER